MARVLLCHVPKDGHIARDLGAALMGRGHFVSFDGEPDTPRPDRLTRLRQFEAVIVLWTETSAQSAGLAAIARETLPLNVLVPVRDADVAAARLPLAFRKLNMPAPRDYDGIARIVARMSAAAASLREMAEREIARRSGVLPAPSAEASPRPQSYMRPLPPPRLSPPPPKAAEEPAQPIALQPVAEPGSGIRVRPLLDLPEVGTPLETEAELEPEPEIELEVETEYPAEPAGGEGAPESEPQTEYEDVTLAAMPSAPTPAPVARLITAEDLAQAVEAGLLLHHIPAAMWLGAPTTVEIALCRDVLAELFPPRQGRSGPAQNLETLSVSLYGMPEVFEIERQSERTQFVAAKHALASRDPAALGRWTWLVTPTAAGPHDLVVRVSALLRDAKGVPAPVALPDRRLSVEIQVPEEESFLAAPAGWSSADR